MPLTDVTMPVDSAPSYTAQLKALYESAKAAGEQVPDDILDWARSDVKRIGTWDYKIVSFTSESEEVMLTELNRLGGERWECFWVETTAGGKRFYMKKAVRSYLQIAGRASKLIPTLGSED